MSEDRTGARTRATSLAVATALTCLSCAGSVGERGPARVRRLLEAATLELGGAERIRAVATWDVAGEGRENLSAEAQGMAPDVPTWREHRERVVVDARTLTVAWQRRTPRNDRSLRFRRLIYGPESTGFVDLTSGRGLRRPGPTPESRRLSLARRVPHLLLLEAATQAVQVAWTGNRELDGEQHDVIEMTTRDGASLTLLLSRSPAELRRLEYRIYLPSRGDVTVGWEWLEWRPDPALGRVPVGHRIEVDGAPFQEVTYSRFAANESIAELLTVPEAGAEATRQAVEPDDATPLRASRLAASGMVAGGVHVARIRGFVVMLVELEDFVVVVEAPESHPALELVPVPRPSSSVSAEHAAWVRSIAGDKPVRYVVVSHHHSDHMGGVGAFAAAGATLLVPPGDVDAARRALAAPHEIVGEASRGGVPATSVEGVPERYVIEDARQRLEVLAVGPNPHTEENLLVWLPRDCILFQGDLFYYAEGAPFPPPGRDTMNRFFAAWIDARGIRPAAVYGVHNSGVAGPGALARSGSETMGAPRAGDC